MNRLSKLVFLSGIMGSALLLSGCAKDSVNESVNDDEGVSENQQTVTPEESKPLTEISKDTELKEQDCKDQYKNEQGICEVPNPEYPQELIDKKYKEEDKEEDKDSEQ